jgi:hypothetical protein
VQDCRIVSCHPSGVAIGLGIHAIHAKHWRPSNPGCNGYGIDGFVRSGERILGDQRPLYAIEGRVTSNLLYANADHILIKVYFVDSKLNILDTADITVDDIAPQGTKAFRRVVPLLPPQGKKFNYSLEVYSVKTSPALHPWPFLH